MLSMPPKLYQFLIGVFASLGSALFGYDLGVIAEAIASPNFNALFNPTTPQTGAVVSVFTGGGFFGAMFAGQAGDRLGRKLTILIGAVIFLLGGSLQTAAQNLSYLYAGRALAGVGVGFLVMIVPLYQVELCHPSIRGRVATLQQFMLGIGALIASAVSYGAFDGYKDSDSRQWRVSLGIQLIPAGILALLIMVFPESPRWLIDNGQPQKGLQVLAKVRAHGNCEDPWVRAEFLQITDQIALDHQLEAKSYADLFKNRASFRRLFLAVALQASVQMTGVSAIQYYSVTIFKQMGIDAVRTLRYQTYNSLIAIAGMFCCMVFVDRFGRRWPLILGNLGNMVTFIIATAILATHRPEESRNEQAAWAFISMTWLFNFSFSATCGPLSWIIPAEIFDTRTRARGVSIATMVSFAFNTMIGQTTSTAMKTIQYKWYYLFCVCNFTNALFFWAFLPETKQKPLEEMNHLFMNAPIFVPAMKREEFDLHDLEMRAAAETEKQTVSHTEETHKEKAT